MKKDIYNIMLNPTRTRIVQALASREKVTANEICELIGDVPRTTLYRHINILIEADIIMIVEEKKIRGSVERTLSLNINELSKSSHSENIPRQAFEFLMGTYAKFEKYFGKDNSVAKGNKIFFNNTVMMLNDDEFDEFLSDMQKLFVKYNFGADNGRKARDISIISAPPTEGKFEK